MNKQTKMIVIVMALLMVAIAAIACAGGGGGSGDAGTPDEPFIGFVPITLKHDVHGNTGVWAEKYARETYGAKYEIIDPDQDLNRSIAAAETFIARGVDGIVFHPVTEDGVREIIAEVRANDINIMTYCVAAHCEQVPALLIDEATYAHEMGADMVKKWIELYPDIPVKLGFISWTDIAFCFDNRTGPFLTGAKTVVDYLPTDGVPRFRDTAGNELYGATYWEHAGGVLEVAMQVTGDAITRHPDVNIVYGDNVSNGLGALAAYEAAGRGLAVDGIPLTELIASTDASAGELRKLADPSSSLLYTLGMQPMTLAFAHVDMIMELINGTLDNDVYIERFAPGIHFNFYKDSLETLQDWFNLQYNPSPPLDLAAEIARS